MAGVDRRRLLAGGVAAASGIAVTAGGLGFRNWLMASSEAVAVGPPAGPSESPSDDSSMRVDAAHLHIVAHPDDDLYFFNPDLLHAIRAGNRVVTICLTSGEADGRNAPHTDAGGADAHPNYEMYAAARHAGLRAAYAKAAIGDPDSKWRREVLPTVDGAVAEIATLEAAPTVQLVFLNMWQEGLRSPLGERARLRTLWMNENAQQPTMRPTGSPVPGVYAYTRTGLLRTLGMLLDRYQPTMVRTMDPDPDYQIHDEHNPRYSDYGDFSDHIDHTPAGLFAWAALQEWWARGGRAAVVESYRGYYNRRWPANLSPEAAQEKTDYLAVYGWADGRDCGDPAGCGDRKVGRPKSLTGYGQSTTHRYSVGSAWLGRGADRRLAAFAVLGGAAVMWTETLPAGGVWSGPIPIGGWGLLPHLSVVQTGDGRWQVFGVRMALAADPAEQRREIVTASQTAPGGGFGGWTSLGNPHDASGTAPERQRCMGMPAAVVDGDGRLYLFARTFRAGVSGRMLDGSGGWGPWRDLGGAGTQDGLTAVTTPGGTVELFASTKSGILRWYQERPGGDFRTETLPVAPPAGPPTVVAMPDGRLNLLVREARTAAIVAYGMDGPGGSWLPQPHRLGGNGGFGPLAGVAYGSDAVAIAKRNDAGTASVAIWPTPDPSASWRRSGPRLVHAPAVAVDALGRTVVAGLCADATLRVAHLQETAAGFGGPQWTIAGGKEPPT